MPFRRTIANANECTHPIDPSECEHAWWLDVRRPGGGLEPGTGVGAFLTALVATFAVAGAGLVATCAVAGAVATFAVAGAVATFAVAGAVLVATFAVAGAWTGGLRWNSTLAGARRPSSLAAVPRAALSTSSGTTMPRDGLCSE
jgi:hypothetical protein